jgi:hypothetical protein
MAGRIRFHLRRVLAILTLTVVALGSSAPATAQTIAYNEQHPILAYSYFMRTAASPDGAREMIREAQSAGIDGFIHWWDGYGGGYDAQLGQLLDAARGTDFRLSIHLHQWEGADGVMAQLRDLYEHRLFHPNWVTYQGRPVIFFWQTLSRLDNATWSRVRAQIDPGRRAIWLADGDNFAVLNGDAWDGISPYAIAWSATPGVHLGGWAARSRQTAPGKLFVPPVSPGCDDRAVRAVTCLQDRRGGAYYQSTLDGALATQPDWAVVVSTFDEWFEQTNIQGDDLYIRMTRDFASAFKGTAAPVIAAPAPGPVAPEPAAAALAPDLSCAPDQVLQFTGAFSALASALGGTMGDPTSCAYAEGADTLQQTSSGLAFFRVGTSIATFTNGWDHWGLTRGGVVYWTGEAIDPP